MLKWLIIGGGIHGTALAFHLTHRKRLSYDTVRILDPHPQLLALWNQFTQNTGMQYLRSPKVHTLHHDPWSIRTFAETRQGKPHADFIPIYERPSLTFFNLYHEWLIDKYRLADLHTCGRAVNLSRLSDGWRVETDSNPIEAENVILAMGASEQPLWADWGASIKQQGAPIHHIFEAGFDRATLTDWSQAVVIGGGISAVQTALTLAKQHPATLRLLLPDELKVAHFDADPCWVTRLCLADFHRESDYDARRQMIDSARQVGSVPPDVAQALDSAIGSGLLRVDIAWVEDATFHDGKIHLRTDNGEMIESDQVILATGFDPKRSGGQLVDDLITEHSLPLANCGYPIVDDTLCWTRGIYVTGGLAELEIGAVARTIIGARLAGERIGRAV